jgi:hypothetical protein
MHGESNPLLQDQVGLSGMAEAIDELTDRLETDWRNGHVVRLDVAERLHQLRADAERQAGFES